MFSFKIWPFKGGVKECLSFKSAATPYKRVGKFLNV